MSGLDCGRRPGGEGRSPTAWFGGAGAAVLAGEDTVLR
jgi:hypothetical protein